MTNQTCRLQRNLINHFHLLNDAFSDMLFTLLQSARLVSGVIENNYQRLGESLRGVRVSEPNVEFRSIQNGDVLRKRLDDCVGNI